MTFSVDRPEFPLPHDLEPIGKRCIVVRVPDDEDYVRIFNGVLMMLQYWFNWERDEDKRGTLVAQIWREVIQDICWKGGVVRALRQQPGKPNMLQWLDCDDVWQDAFDFSAIIIGGNGGDTGDILTDVITQNTLIDNIYQGDITNIWPQINDNGDINRNLAWCGALSILVDALCAGAIAAIASSDENEAQRRLTTAAAIAGVLAAALEVAVFFVAPESVLAALLAKSAVSAGIAGAITYLVALVIPDPTPPDYAPYQNETAKEAVACCVYDTISSSNDVEFDMFKQAILDCPFDEGTDEYKIQQVAITAFQSLLTFLNFAQYVAGVYGAIDYGVSFPCPCVGWCFNFDFSDNNDETWHTTTDWTQGTYVNGLGWTTQDEVHSNAGRRALKITHECSGTVIKKVIVRFDYTRGTYDEDFTAFAIDIDGTRVMEKRYSQMVNGSAQELIWEGARTTGSNAPLVVLMSSSLDTHSPYNNYSGAILLTSIEWQGENVSPIETADNCLPD